jgi:hypothetical protein
MITDNMITVFYIVNEQYIYIFDKKSEAEEFVKNLESASEIWSAEILQRYLDRLRLKEESVDYLISYKDAKDFLKKNDCIMTVLNTHKNW